MLLGPCMPRPQEDGFVHYSLPSRPHLPDELALLVHTDVFLALSSLDAHPASEGVCLHYELGCGGGGAGGKDLCSSGLLAQGCQGTPTSLPSEFGWGALGASPPRGFSLLSPCSLHPDPSGDGPSKAGQGCG